MSGRNRLALLLVVLLLMSAAYFAGTLVASGQQDAGTIAAPNLTAAQWAAIQGANLLLLDQSGAALYLPLIDN